MIFLAAAAAILLSGCVKDKNEQEATSDEHALVKAGDLVPDISITSIGEGESYLSRSETRRTLIYFWRWDCSYCAGETPTVLALYKSVATNPNVRIVSIMRGDTGTSYKASTYWAEQLDAAGLTPADGPAVYYDENREVFDQFASGYVPRFCVVASDGKVEWNTSGEFSLEVLSRRLLGY